jgi:alkyl hydroperoxide reductase subunit AhpC
MIVKVGTPAPPFRAEAYRRGESGAIQVELTAYRGRWVVLFFYPRDFTFLCPTELRAFAELQAAFALEGASVLAASTDSWHVHRAWLETSSGLAGIRYPVLADPVQELTSAYGVLNSEDGSAHPVTFIIDPSGIVRDISIAGPGTRRRPEETLETLRELRMSELQAVA